MKQLSILILAIACLFTTVEIPAQEDGEAGDSEPVEERNCISAEELEQSAGDESGPSEEGAGEDEDTDLPLCDEETPEDALPGDLSEDEEPTSEDADSDEEEDVSSEIDPSQEFEVDPEDEISEDYPVPLPSDI